MTPTLQLQPIPLPPNQPSNRPYRGGRGIARFRGSPHTGDFTPEDFVASTTETFSGAGIGLTRFDDGVTLVELIESEPVGFLGPDHVHRYGADPRLLVKLLDTAERLFVHFHPDDDFARRHLGHISGKTEAWHILGTDGEGEVWLGFRRDVDIAEVEQWYSSQCAEQMLAAMHRIIVRPGDSVLVPAGVPHALGSGITLVELQQPEDLSILLEYQGYHGLTADQATLGLPSELAWTALNRNGWTHSQLRQLVRPRPPDDAEHRTLPLEADRYFRLDRLQIDGTRRLDPCYEVIVVINGAGAIASDTGTIQVEKGQTILLPYGSGSRELSGRVTALRCRPPL